MQAILDWVVTLDLVDWALLFAVLAVYSGLLAFWVGAKVERKTAQQVKQDCEDEYDARNW